MEMGGAVVAIRKRSFATWDEWRHDLYSLLFSSARFEEGRFLFRGIGDGEWSLTASFDRYSPEHPLGERDHAAKELLQLFREECRDDYSIEPCPEQLEDLLPVAQHFGVPTRGLDWTESPFIGAYFAFADAATNARSSTGDVAIWALDVQHPAWSKELGVEIMRRHQRNNERIARQRGALTYLRGPFGSLDEYVQHVGSEQVALWQFTLPRHEAIAALSDLSAMGITATRLFPDRTGAARAALLRYTLRHA